MSINHPKEGTYGPSWRLVGQSVKLVQIQMETIRNQERLIRFYKQETKKMEKRCKCE